MLGGLATALTFVLTQGGLNLQRSAKLIDEMRAAGLPM
jgi:hypothetical protein